MFILENRNKHLSKATGDAPKENLPLMSPDNQQTTAVTNIEKQTVLL